MIRQSCQFSAGNRLKAGHQTRIREVGLGADDKMVENSMSGHSVAAGYGVRDVLFCELHRLDHRLTKRQISRNRSRVSAARAVGFNFTNEWRSMRIRFTG